MDRNLIAMMIETTKTQIKTCRLIETRMVDQYVLATEDGQVLTLDGVKNFGVSLEGVQRTGERSRIVELKQHVRENNPDNKTAQTLKIMGWKKAARLQREIAEKTLKKLEEL